MHAYSTPYYCTRFRDGTVKATIGDFASADGFKVPQGSVAAGLATGTYGVTAVASGAKAAVGSARVPVALATISSGSKSTSGSAHVAAGLGARASNAVKRAVGLVMAMFAILARGRGNEPFREIHVEVFSPIVGYVVDEPTTRSVP